MNNVEYSKQTERWGIFELTLKGPEGGNPFVDVSIGAQFRYENRVIEAQVCFYRSMDGTLALANRMSACKISPLLGLFMKANGRTKSKLNLFIASTSSKKRDSPSYNDVNDASNKT